MLTAHKVKGGARAAPNNADALGPRQDLLQLWNISLIHLQSAQELCEQLIATKVSHLQVAIALLQ